MKGLDRSQTIGQRHRLDASIMSLVGCGSSPIQHSCGRLSCGKDNLEWIEYPTVASYQNAHMSLAGVQIRSTVDLLVPPKVRVRLSFLVWEMRLFVGLDRPSAKSVGACGLALFAGRDLVVISYNLDAGRAGITHIESGDGLGICPLRIPRGSMGTRIKCWAISL